MARFSGKVAFITGGARGIGRATAQAFSAEGARVIVADVDADAAEAPARALGGGAIGVGIDVAD
ncbi:MAG TPA: SDR family NAD(P)-dependent oxidoreductase, partial [Polyangia bacterium]|nr:SDR family NAD(P)-dependent oxidoreductase [Polyangia bacterium]